MSEPIANVRRDPADVVLLYSRIARIYEAWGRVADSRVRRHVRELVRASGGGNVVEVGCGTGALLVALARDNPHGLTVGIDLAPGMVAAARRRLARDCVSGVMACHGDAQKTTLADDAVDVMTCSYVLDILSLQQIISVLTEFRRVLRPAGRLVLVNATPAERRIHRIPELMYGSAIPLTSNCRGIHAAPLLAQLGFTHVTRRYVSQLGMPSEIISAVKCAAGAPKPDDTRQTARKLCRGPS